MSKVYKTHDLFHADWVALSPQVHAEVFAMSRQLDAMDKDSKEYGYLLIALMAKLRKNSKLVNQINEEQLVDCYTDLAFLKQPWHTFRQKEFYNFFAPDDELETHTFDHFIYADNEFTLFMVKPETIYLARLAASLYRYNNEQYFEREKIEQRANFLLQNLKVWELNLIYFTYAHIRNKIVSRCKYLLPTAEPSDEPSTPNNTGPMWMQLKHRLAETLPFAGFDTAGKANVYDALDYLDGLQKIKERANA